MENKLNEVLQDHEKRISALEALYGKSRKTKTNAVKQSLSDRIIELRDKGFFSKPKTAEETLAKIIEKYHCELNRVEVSLVRLAKRKQLRISSKIISGKKYKSYTW